MKPYTDLIHISGAPDMCWSGVGWGAIKNMWTFLLELSSSYSQGCGEPRHLSGLSTHSSTAHSLLIYHRLLSPSFSAQPITERPRRLLPVSFAGALDGFDVSINTREPGTKS